MANPEAFEFGRNWLQFLQCVDEDRVRTAEASLLEFMGRSDLRGQTFLDIGCGSGLFSYAAHRLGAARVHSFDVDPFSVRCCRHWHAQVGEPADWTVEEGSVLDRDYVERLGTFDIVYSWGVLHHTGRMWEAIENAASRVADGGDFYLAIYNAKRGLRGWKYWLRVKKLYNRLPPPGRRLMEWMHVAYYFQSKLLRFKNPWRIIGKYQSKRGMNWRTDITDWLGGYPYEVATVEQIFHFVRGCDPRFQLENLSTTDGLGTNSFLFRKRV